MKKVSFAEVVSAFRKAGLRQGDIVNIHSRLFAIGVVEDVLTDDIPQIYLRALQEVIGEEGTVVVPTYTTSFARHGTPFVLEETPSEMGVFSELVRTTPKAVRTLHPVQSLTALGGQSTSLAENHPRWNVGYDTVWDRMLKRGGKVLSIGIPLKNTMSFMHQVEFMACVPYLYHKVIRGSVFAKGQPVEHDFLMAVRYLEYGITYELSRLDDALTKSRALLETPLGGSALWTVSLEAAFDVGINGLRRDPYYLLEKPPSFVEGKIPCDGLTIQREGTAPRYFLA